MTTYLDTSQLSKKMINGLPSVFETEPVQIAMIPLEGGDGSLSDSVIVHPRYVPQGMKHEIINVRGLQRGRTLYIDLTEKPFKPIVHEGVEYPILNIKGAGADADKPMIIHPDIWYHMKIVNGEIQGKWGPKTQYYKDYVFGGLYVPEGESEYSGLVLKGLNIPHSPHHKLNILPDDLCSRISVVESSVSRNRYSQLQRLCMTDVRMDLDTKCAGDGGELIVEEELKQKYLDELIIADSWIINSHFDLLTKGKTLNISGYMTDNRYIDTKFTDEDNLAISDFDAMNNSVSNVPIDLICISIMYLPNNLRRKYLNEVGKRIGVSFETDSYSRMSISAGLNYGNPILLTGGINQAMQRRIDGLLIETYGMARMEMIDKFMLQQS